MKTEEILRLDYMKDENKEIIQKVLRKIKPLSKCSDEIIPLEMIEKVAKVLVCKYEITPQWMTMDYRAAILGVYKVGVKTTTDHKWLGDVYGCCLYEVMAKLVIKMYSDIKTQNIAERSLSKEEAERERRARKVDKEREESEDDWE